MERMNTEQCGALISSLVQREGCFRRAQQSADAKVVPIRA